jgi:DNA (cytosine-5)-methyltransferase 1
MCIPGPPVSRVFGLNEIRCRGQMQEHTQATRQKYSTAGLFAGIGGIEVGLARAGHHPILLCENDPAAQSVLTAHFPTVPLMGDVRHLRSLGTPGIVCAGFPCQDLSQAGKTAGIRGVKSRLINEVFRLLDSSAVPDWLIIENVPFMLHLRGGTAICHIVSELERRGFRWAYRVVDTRAFGIPQRRRRVLLLASKTLDPRPALLNQDAGPHESPLDSMAYGFYWTEGNTGLGWAQDAIPTLKGGSGLGIPSPPAIWVPGKGLFLPDIRDAERLQGFGIDWTLPATDGQTQTGLRWKLVGNAVSVPVAEWLGNRICCNELYNDSIDLKLGKADRWPFAAWGERGERFTSPRSSWPIRASYSGLLGFLMHPLKPLSSTATRGFLSRARASRLRFADGFLDGVAQHLESRISEKRMGRPRYAKSKDSASFVACSK